MNDKGQQFYEYLKSVNIDVPSSYGEFQSAMQDQGIASQFYDFVKSQDIDVPETSQEFQSVFSSSVEGEPVNFTNGSQEPQEQQSKPSDQSGVPLKPKVSFSDFEVEEVDTNKVDIAGIDINKYNPTVKKQEAGKSNLEGSFTEIPPFIQKTTPAKKEVVPTGKTNLDNSFAETPQYLQKGAEKKEEVVSGLPQKDNKEEINQQEAAIDKYVKDVFTSTPAKPSSVITKPKPIVKEAEVKKIAEVAKSIDNEEDYSMFSQALDYISQVSNSFSGEVGKAKTQGESAIKEVAKTITDYAYSAQDKASSNAKIGADFISNIPSYANRVLIKYGIRDQVVDESSIVPFRDVERSTQPIDVSQINTETVQDTIATNTQIFDKVNDNFWRSMLNVDLKGNKKDPDIEYNLNVFRNVFDAVNGFTYAPIPSNGNTNAPNKLEGISGVAHFFIRDGRPKEFKDVWDSTNEDLKKESEWFKKGGYSDKEGYDISNFKKIKDDQYVPVFKKTDNGDLRVSYKKKGDVTENDYVTQNLKQYKYGEIDWKKTTTDKQYGEKINVLTTTKGKSIPSLPVLDGVTADGKAVKGQELYSRFSGSATVFLFEKDGKLIADDFSGSANNIKSEAERISKKYDVPLNDITLGFYDAGSYSAKPYQDSKGFLNRKQWYDYNVKLESGSGIGFKK